MSDVRLRRALSDEEGEEWESKLLSWHDCRELLPFFERSENASRKMTGSFTDPLTGYFGWLPAEVLSVVVEAVLELRPFSPRRAVLSARCLRHFMLTCRGAASVVSRAQVMEAVSRIHLRLTPMPGTEPANRAYYANHLTYIRSAMELSVTLSAFSQFINHCASITEGCCRYARGRFNEAMLAYNNADPKTERGRCALEAWGPGRTRIGVQVAGGLGTLLVCRTDRGALIHKPHEYVQCVEAGSPATYSPESELVVTFREELTPQETVIGAASSGDLLVVALAVSVGQEQPYPFGNNPLQLKTYDLKTNALIDVRNTDLVERLWVCNDTVYRLSVSEKTTGQLDYHMVIDQFQPRAVGAPEWHDKQWATNRAITHPWNVAISKCTGNVALCCPDLFADRVDEIFHFDVSTQEEVVVDRPGPRTAQSLPSIIEVSPAGDAIVYIGRALEDRCISVYEGHNWICTHRVFVGRAPNDAFGLHHNHHSFWSPCGGTLCVIVRSAHGAAYILVNMRITRAPWASHKTVRCDIKMLALHSTPKKLAWSNDGIYMQTTSDSGVLRVGSF